MTIPSERWQAVKYAEALLVALAHYQPITDDMRNRARYILRTTRRPARRTWPRSEKRRR